MRQAASCAIDQPMLGFEKGALAAGRLDPVGCGARPPDFAGAAKGLNPTTFPIVSVVIGPSLLSHYGVKIYLMAALAWPSVPALEDQRRGKRTLPPKLQRSQIFCIREELQW